MTEKRGSMENSGIYAVLITDSVSGYTFIEGESQAAIEGSIQGIKVISGRAIKDRVVPLEELGDILNPRPSIEGLSEGDIVEIIDGPLKGSRAKITRLEENSQEITAELMDTTMALPIRLHSDYVKRVQSSS